MPESMHMVMWIMSDRTIPRSLRMIEGFGVHTFRLVDAQGASTFVKFHFRPALGLQSTVWDEAVKIAGADPDFHRRDLFEAIERGDYPEWELAVQLFTEDQAAAFPFDPLDATKLVPEELVPLTVIGKLVLDRWPDNFFAETEQVAFCPANVVPGIDFTNDPLLQGRLFSYLDTQLTRLGGPNFQQIPINAPKCPFANHQRDGFMQQERPKGRVAYEPSSLDPSSPRESAVGFRSDPTPSEMGVKDRKRSSTFADHYSQARLFYRSQSAVEQAHLASALVFELSKVAHAPIRERMVAHLALIDEALGARVATGLGMEGSVTPAQPIVPLVDMPPSPALRLVGKTPPTLKGRAVGILVADGSSSATVTALQLAIQAEGAVTKIVAPKVGGTVLDPAAKVAADGQLAGTPSVMFDAVAVVLSKEGAAKLAKESAAIDFVRDAFGHLKAIFVDEGGKALVVSHALPPTATQAPS